MFQLDPKSVDQRRTIRIWPVSPARKEDDESHQSASYQEWFDTHRRELEMLIPRLPTKQRGVVVKLYGLNGMNPFTQAEIADLEGVSRAAISKRHQNAMNSLIEMAKTE